MEYTQSPAMSREEIDSFLNVAQTARFCSPNEDGTIHAAPVWYKYEKGQMIIGTPEASRKARNIKRNANATILVDLSEGDQRPKDVMIYGKAEAAPSIGFGEKYPPEAVQFFQKYMPRDKAESQARGLSKLTKWVMITVKPQRIASFDYEKDEAFRNAVRG